MLRRAETLSMASRPGVKQLPPLLLLALAVTFCLPVVSGHRYGAGKCANVTPMDGFDADRVRSEPRS